MPPTLGWSRTVSGPNLQTAVAVTPIGRDGVVIGGHTTASLDLGDGPLAYVGGEDGLLVRYDATGAYRWARTFGTPGDDSIFDLATDAAGNIYAVGHLAGATDFGGGVIPAVGDVDAFIASYSADGAYRWAKILGSSNVNGETGFGVVVDAAGRVHVTGWYGGTIDFGDAIRTPVDGQDVMLLVLDALTGTTIYSRSFGGQLSNQGQKIALGRDGRIAIGGVFSGTLDFGRGELPAAGLSDAFVGVLDTAGTPQWSLFGGGSMSDRGIDVAIGADLETYLCGLYESRDADFGLGPMVAMSTTDGFLLRLQPDGTPQWLVKLAGNGGDRIDSVHVTAAGRVLATGTFNSTQTMLGDRAFGATGMGDSFIAEVDDAGNVAWLTQLSGEGGVTVSNVTSDPDDVIYLVGFVTGPVDFGDGLHATNGSDAFLVRLVP